MKITPILLTLPLMAGFAFAEEKTDAPKKESVPAKKIAAPGAEKEEAKEEKPAPAEGSWEAVEALLKGPKDRPKTKEEAQSIYKSYLEEFDKASAAYAAANPKDGRRWKLALHKVRMNDARKALDLAPLADEDMNKLLAEIITAEDADKDTRGQASFTQVMQMREKPEEFVKLAEAHQKAFPDLPMNRMLEMQLKTIESEKALKEKPLELSFTATDGKEVDVSKMRGKVILIDFWATWCGPCVAEIPNVVKTYNSLHEKGFEIVGISFDQDKDKLEKMTKDKEMPWPQYFDGEGWKNKFGQQYGINSIPRMWLVDKKGMVVDFNARQDLEKKVEKLLAE